MISRLLRASAALSADCLLAKVTKAQCFRSICIAKHKVIFRTKKKTSCNMSQTSRQGRHPVASFLQIKGRRIHASSAPTAVSAVKEVCLQCVCRQLQAEHVQGDARPSYLLHRLQLPVAIELVPNVILGNDGSEAANVEGGDSCIWWGNQLGQGVYPVQHLPCHGIIHTIVPAAQSH